MKTYIWDLDGTLFDSYDVIIEAAILTANEIGIFDSKEEALYVAKTSSVSAYLKQLSDRSNVLLEQIYQINKKYAHINDDKITLIEGAKETLKTLKEKGAKNYVFTHRGSTAEPLLKRLGILSYFDEIVTSVYGFNKKPAGDGIDYLVKKYHLDVNETYYVGDRTLDVECAKNAGIKAILFLPKDSLVKSTGKEDKIIENLLDLLK